MPIQRRRKPVSEGRLRTSVFRILRGNELCSISTVSRGSRAHINTAFFAYSNNLELYFLSDPASLHCRNLRANPSMAMAIFNSSQRWDRPGRGIQLFGPCHRTRDRASVRASEVYEARFPSFARWLKERTSGDRRQAALLRSYAFYRFLPNRVKILDEAEFGGAVFIVAAIRRPRRGGTSRVRLAWHATETLVPDERRRRER